MMVETEGVWRCPFVLLPILLKLKFLVEENAYFRWEERMRKKIAGSPRDDWLWAENYVNFTWPHVVIQALFPEQAPISSQKTYDSTEEERY